MSTEDYMRANFADAPGWALYMCSKMDDVNNKLDRQGAIAEYAKERADAAVKTAEGTQEQVDVLEERVKQLENTIQQQEDYSRRENLVFQGIPEQNDSSMDASENVESKIRSVLQDHLHINDEIKFQRCHRLGGKKPNAKYPRPIIVRFLWFQDRMTVWQSRSRLQGTKIFLREDHSRKTEEARKKLWPYAKAAKVAKASNFFKGDILFLERKPYTVDTISQIPDKFHPSKSASRDNGDIILFHGKESFLSNFHPGKFKLENITYDHNEQYYQSKKAEHFRDDRLAHKIKATPDPHDCYKLGYKVKNFDEGEWQKVMEKVMQEGAMAKFSQNEQLKQSLLSTTGKVLAESSTDMDWATGVPIHAADAFDVNKWTGRNLLGSCLSLVRTRIK